MPTFLYAIGHPNGPVKIGVSNNPEGRLAQFQTSCPFRIELLHAQECESREIAFADETFLHRHLREKWIFGEWFNVSGASAKELVSSAVWTGVAFRERAA